MIFLIILIYLIMSCLLFDFGRVSRTYSIINFYIACIILVITSGIKYRVGGDPLSYYDDYPSFPTIEELGSVDFSNLKYEPSFYGIVAICKIFSPEFYVFQLVQSLVINGTCLIFLKTHTKYVFTATLLYYILFYFYFMEIMRESFCIAIFLFSLKYFFKKRYIVYFALAAISFTIHLSGLFMFAFPFLYWFCSKGWKILILTSLVGISIFLFIINNPFVFVQLIPIKILLKIVGYNLLGIYWPTVILNYIHVIAIVLLIQLNIRFRPDQKWLIPILKLYALILCITIAVQGVYRLTNYICIIEIIAILNILRPVTKTIIKHQVSFVKYSTAVSFIFILKLYAFTISTDKYYPNSHFYNLYIPYETIFDPVNHQWRENIYYIEQQDKHLKLKRK